MHSVFRTPVLALPALGAVVFAWTGVPFYPVKAQEVVAAKADLPVSFPKERYAALFEKSPFAISTAVPEPAPVSTENFATNWVLTGISKQRDNDGKELFTVFVRSRDLATRLVLTGDHPSDDGVTVSSGEEAAVPATSVVFLKKGSETGRIEFDQATVAAAASTPQAMPPGAARPGGGGKNPAAVKNGAKNGAAIPRPGLNAIPRPGGMQPPAPAQAGAGVGAGAGAGVGAGAAPASQQEPRRRVRPIQDPPTPEPP